MRLLLSFFLSISMLFGGSVALWAVTSQSGIDLFVLNTSPKEGSISLTEAVSLALKDNNSIKIAEKNVEIYNQLVRQYWSYVYPQISISGSYSRTLHPQEMLTSLGNFSLYKKNYTQGSADANLLLWSGGAVSAGINIGDFYSQSGYLQLLETQNKIKDTVYVLCYGIILSHALIQVQQENLDIAKDHLKEINLKYKQGLASDLDVLNQKVKVSNSEPPLISAKNSYDLGLLTLRRVLNKDPEEPLYLTWKLEDITDYEVPSLEYLYKISEDNRPELVISALQVKIADEQIKIAKAEHYGQLYAFAQATYTGNSDKVIIPASSYNSSYGTSVGLKFQLPIFEGFKVSSLVTQKELALEQAQLLAQDTRRNIRIEVKRAWLNLGEAKQRIKSTKGTIEQARKNLNRTNIRYRNGLASRLDLDDSSLLLYNAELEFVQAVHDGFKAISNLNYAVGKEVIIK